MLLETAVVVLTVVETMPLVETLPLEETLPTVHMPVIMDLVATLLLLVTQELLTIM